MVDMSLVGSAGIFKGLGESELSTLRGIAREQTVGVGETVSKRSEFAENLYVVETGRFTLTMPLWVCGSNAEMVVRELGPGNAFGWSALVAPHKSVHSSVCLEEGVLMVLPGAALRPLFEDNAALGQILMSNLCELVASRLHTLQELWLEEVEQSMDRVQHWTNSPGNARLRSALRCSAPKDS